MAKTNQLSDAWVVGFVDGDGCFSFSGDRYSFVVSQDQDSISVLYDLKTKFGCGYVNKTHGYMWEYRVSSKKHLIDIILPFFVKNTLQTKKIYSFQKFYEGLTGNTYNIPVTRTLSNDWMIGFIDAEGSFTIHQVKSQNNKLQVKFSLGQAEKDILDRIQKHLGYGNVTARNPTKGNQYYCFEITAYATNLSLIKLCTTSLNRCLLKTNKRISFLRFKKCVNIAINKKHTTPEGVEYIQKLISYKDKQKGVRRNYRQQAIIEKLDSDPISEEQE